MAKQTHPGGFALSLEVKAINVAWVFLVSLIWDRDIYQLGICCFHPTLIFRHRVVFDGIVQILIDYLGHFTRINFNPNRGDWIFTDQFILLGIFLQMTACLVKTGFKIKSNKGCKVGQLVSNWLVSLSIRDKLKRSVTARIMPVGFIQWEPWQNLNLIKRHHLGLPDRISHWSKVFAVHDSHWRQKRRRSPLARLIVSCKTATRPEDKTWFATDSKSAHEGLSTPGGIDGCSGT